MKKLLIKKSFDVFQAAKMDEKGRLEDYFAINLASEAGNIYIGRIENVRGGNCFVNYGGAENGILPYDKTMKAGDLVRCQAVREAVDGKGAILRKKIMLTGRFCIVGDGIIGVKFSKKIKNKDFKERLKAFSDCIIRSEAEFFPFEEVEKELKNLQASYEKILSLPLSKIDCIYQESAVSKLLKEFSLADTEIIAERNVDAPVDVKFSCYEGIQPIFRQFNIDKEIEKLFERKVETGGVELVFDETEAMHVIDVNAKNSLSLKPLAINKKAAEIAVKHIRLRNLGGLIIIDFLGEGDMDDLKKFIESLLFFDREDTKVEAVNNLSLIAINRKKRYNAFNKVLHKEYARAPKEIKGRGLNLCDEIRSLYAQEPFSTVTVKIPLRHENSFISDYNETVKVLLPRLKTYVITDEDEQVIIGNAGGKPIT